MAWRGFALPRFQSRYNALTSSLIVGILWALWHLPLLLVKDSVMSSYPLMPYFVRVIASSIVYAWLYNNRGGSVLIVTIFHAVSNTVGPNAGVEQTAVMLILAPIIVVSIGPTHLSRRRERIAQNVGADILNR